MKPRGGGGLIEFVRKSLNIEIIFSEVTISNKNWIIISIYIPPHYSNLLAFFKEPGKYLNQACENYDNIIIRGDFNIDIRQTNPESHKLDEFCSLFSLTMSQNPILVLLNFTALQLTFFYQTNQIYFKKQTLLKLALATITSSYVLFLNLVSKGLNQRLFTTETSKNLMWLIF